MANGKKKTTTAIVEPAVPVTTSKSGIVTIPGVRTESFRTLIIGTAPLLVHKFSEKGRIKILAKHMGEASAGREIKDPLANFEGARYRLTDGSDGVPAGGMKAAIVKGFSKASGVAMTQGKGAIRVTADDKTTNLVRVIGPPIQNQCTRVMQADEAARESVWPFCQEAVVRNESGVVDIRHRPQYFPWAILLEIEFLPTACSMRQVLQALATSGFKEGLCEWRPGSKESLSGSLGTWRLADPEEVAAYDEGRLFTVANGKKKRTAA
jgi:hypothetical protein